MSGALGILLAFIAMIVLSLAIVTNYELCRIADRERRATEAARKMKAYRDSRWKEIFKMMEVRTANENPTET